MTLSSFTGFTPLQANSKATVGLWNRPYSTISRNLDQLNADASALSSRLSNVAESGHSHDDLYYRKAESDASYAASSHTHAAADVDVGTFADGRIAASSVTQHQAQIDHDALAGFVSAEHVDWTQDSGSTIDAGNLPPEVARYDDSDASFDGQVYSKRTDTAQTGSEVTFDFADGNPQKTQLDSDATLHFVNARAGGAYVIEVQQAGASAHSVTWPGGAVPSTETLPTMPSANSETLVASVYAQSGSTFMVGEFGTGRLEG